jgi:hypothetical protein
MPPSTVVERVIVMMPYPDAARADGIDACADHRAAIHAEIA